MKYTNHKVLSYVIFSIAQPVRTGRYFEKEEVKESETGITDIMKHVIQKKYGKEKRKTHFSA
jgi:hypothetical protein